jgi:hypothetical protein
MYMDSIGAKPLAIVDEFEYHARDMHFATANRIGTPSQRQALESRLIHQIRNRV